MNKYITNVQINGAELEIIYSNGDIVKEEANYENYKNALKLKAESLEKFNINGLIETIKQVNRCKLACLAGAAMTLIIPNFEIMYFLVFILGFTILHFYNNTMIETRDNYFEFLSEEANNKFSEAAPLLTKQKKKVFTEAKDYEKVYLNTKDNNVVQNEKPKTFIKTKK